MSKKISESLLSNMGLTSARQYKSLKRKQIREVLKAIDELQLGCCEIPGFDFTREDCTFRRLKEAATDLKERMKVKNWGN